MLVRQTLLGVFAVSLVCVFTCNGLKQEATFTGSLEDHDLEEEKEEEPEGPPPSCPEKCEQSHCPPVTTCEAGLVRDRCGCCDVCGLEEGHLCNTDEDLETGKAIQRWYGLCGVDLACRVRQDIDPKMAINQSICYCVSPGEVCGSNGITYTHCGMQAQIVRTKNEVEQISNGPCKAQPRIVKIAKSQTVNREQMMSFLCEVEGYPIPSIIWYFSKPGSLDSQKLPGDSDEINLSVRGGPNARGVSSYLQITHFSDKHEGTYRCHADSDMGMDTKEFSLVLKD